MFSRPPYYSGITADCATVFLDVIVFVCVMKPSAFRSLSTIPLISATVDIRNTILRNSRRGAGRERDDRARQGERGVWERRGTSAGRCRREEKKRRRKEKRGMAAVIAVADGYEVKADGVSD